MKKYLSFVSSVLALIMIISAAVPALALDSEKTFEQREVTAYLYSPEKTKTVICLFETDMPDVPYIEILDYLDAIQVIPRTVTDNGDGTFTVSGETGTMVADTANDTVFFDNYENFALSGTYSEGTWLEANFLQRQASSVEGGIKPLTLDLGKYGIDIVSYDGKLYIPICAMNDMVFAAYNCAEYVDGNIYFVHTMEEKYFDRSSLYSNLQRSEKMAEYSYNEICFIIDTFYGRPSKAKLAASIDEKGFDKTLDEYSDKTRMIKSLLLSTDLVDFYIGLASLTDLFFDGGHTVMYYDPITSAQEYPDSAFGKIWNDNFSISTEEKWVMVYNAITFNAAGDIRKQLVPMAKAAAYSEYETVKEWGSAAKLIACGDMVVFSFDKFVNEVIEPFKWSLDYAKENGIKNFLIDLTTNGGGSTAIVEYIITMITNIKNRSANSSFLNYYSVSDNTMVVKSRVDLDLNGEFNEEDDEVVYDFNFAMTTSSLSFSCGNLLPVLAKENGLLLLGETSGGGTCSIAKACTSRGTFYISDFIKFIWSSGEDVDGGAPVDYDLTKPYSLSYDLTQFGIEDPAAAGIYDYDGFYEFDKISALISEFYAITGDADGDGELNNKDVVELFRYASAAASPEYSKILDVNEDGEVNNKDVAALFSMVSAA